MPVTNNDLIKTALLIEGTMEFLRERFLPVTGIWRRSAFGMRTYD